MTLPATSRMRLQCPHCNSRARIRYSESMSPLYRDAWVDCTNVECGWRGKMAVQYISTLTPSQRPNPSIRLPQSQSACIRPAENSHDTK